MKLPQTTTRDIARELARKYSTMTHDELDILESILVPMKFKKGERIISEGETCRHIYYLDRGLIRQFYFKNGKEVTEHLGSDRSIFMCIESLFKEEPTRLQAEALENSFVYGMPLTELERVARAEAVLRYFIDKVYTVFSEFNFIIVSVVLNHIAYVKAFALHADRAGLIH